VSWFDDKELSSGVDVINWNSFKKKKMVWLKYKLKWYVLAAFPIHSLHITRWVW